MPGTKEDMDTWHYNPKTNRKLKREHCMTYADYLKLMLDAAIDIKTGNFDSDYGICENLSYKVNSAIAVKFPEEFPEYIIGDGKILMNSWRILRSVFCTWPKFSGDANFPIDDPYEIETPEDAYVRLSKWTGAYGALRFELLDHVIDCLKKEIEKE